MSMSSKKCCVPGCFDSGGSHKTLHLFPNPSKERQRFNTWVMAVGGDIFGLNNDDIYKHRRVCHAHFESKFCCRLNRLSNIAVPTLLIPSSTSVPKFTFAERRPMSQIQGSSSSNPSSSSGVQADLKRESGYNFDLKENIDPEVQINEPPSQGNLPSKTPVATIPLVHHPEVESPLQAPAATIPFVHHLEVESPLQAPVATIPFVHHLELESSLQGNSPNPVVTVATPIAQPGPSSSSSRTNPPRKTATKGPELAKQLKVVIGELQEAGLIVAATVCDQGTNNRHAVKLLIQETRGAYLRTGREPKPNVICINNQEIVPLYDPPHLLKCIRNNLLTKNLQYTNADGKLCTASWDHVKSLHAENPQYNGVRLIPKLTDNHVLAEKISKMKVKYATQVFSRNVAIHMGYFAGKGIIPKACAETADILLFFDSLFDSFNGSHAKKDQSYGKPLLAPVTSNSAHTKYGEKQSNE